MPHDYYCTHCPSWTLFRSLSTTFYLSSPYLELVGKKRNWNCSTRGHYNLRDNTGENFPLEATYKRIAKPSTNFATFEQSTEVA